MATHNKTLQLIASKLGLADEDKVLRKAAEFERLLQTKATAGSNMSDTSKIVICLDLAAYTLGIDVDTKTAIKYSGLKQSAYTNCRKIVENLLELNNKLTVPGVCVKLQCTGVQALAENILEEYQKQAKRELDLSLPQYVCMAVYQACRLNQVKVSKAKFLETSRLKPSQWGKLEVDWAKFVDENFAAVKKRGRPVKNIAVKEDEMEIDKLPKEEPSEPQMESYEDWKSRMLGAAYKELAELEPSQKQLTKELKIDEMEVDRRSPRKHSQSRKNSQLTSPRKNKNLLKITFSSNKDQLKIQDSKHLSPGKVSQCLPPRKECFFSSGKDILSPKQEDMSPRRSPRKTPQKYSPYKSPSGLKSVRLLFPNY